MSSLCEDCGLNGEEEFNTHRNDELGWVPCNKCGLVLAVLQEHMFREVSTLSCICGKCGKLYLTEQEVKDHMDSDHTNVVLCDICDPKFSTLNAMTVHKEPTHVPPPHKIQCSKCDFKTNLMTSY